MSRSDVSYLRRFCFLICLTAICLAVSAPAEAQFGNQQQQRQTQKQQSAVSESKGTITDVVRKGRSLTLMIKSEGGGEPIPVAITPRLQFAVEAKADDGFLREKQVVSGRGTLTNEALFVKNWTVHLGPAARRMRGGVQKAEKVIGESVNSYDVLGQVVSRQTDKDYPDYETLTLNVPALKGKPVYIDKGATVVASLSETDKIAAGNNCEIKFALAPNGQPVILSVKVMLDEELKSEDYFKDDEDEKPGRTSRRRRSSATETDDKVDSDEKAPKTDSEN
ncbi:hypothetical protein GC176_11550 [bacterium]|nr:hypothetical protein [bacterium]